MGVFLILALVVSVVAHLTVRRFVFAVLLSALVSAALFQVIVRIQLGYLDPFFVIAFVTTSAAAVVISSVTGLVVSSLKKDRERQRQ